MLLDNPHGILDQNIAFGGQFDGLADSFKKLLSDFIFKPLDLHAHGRLRPVDLAPRPGKSFGVGQGDKRS
jgi:hypothetical protein